MILETSKVQKWSMGSKESTEGQGRPSICDLPCVVKSVVTIGGRWKAREGRTHGKY